MEKDDKEDLVGKYTAALHEIEGRPATSHEAVALMKDEIKKLESLEKNSAEFNVTRSYLEWLTVLPWGLYSQDVLNLKHARMVLDEVGAGAITLFYTFRSCTYTATHTDTHSHTRTHSLTHSNSHTHSHTHTHSYTHTHSHSHTHSHTHTHSLTHTHSHTHSHTHTHTHSDTHTTGPLRSGGNKRPHPRVHRSRQTQRHRCWKDNLFHR
jgi:hypothetical protein